MKKLLTLAIVLSLSTLVGAYSLSGYKWTNTPVGYYINPLNTQGNDPAMVIADIQAAANAWAIQSGTSATARYLGTTGTCAYAYDQTNNICFRADPTVNYIAATQWWAVTGSGQILDFDIIYNEIYPLNTHDEVCTGYFIQDVGTHEMGHAFGLNHSDVGTATMYPTTGSCTHDHESLDPDDIAAIQAVYTNAPPPPPPPTVPGVPVSPTPSSGAVIKVPPPVTLHWTSTGATSYTVTVNGSNKTTTSNSLSLGKVSSGTYTWSVVATNSAGSTSGPIWTFKVK